MKLLPAPAPPGTVCAPPERPLFTARPLWHNLKRKTIHGVAATLSAQGTQFVLGIGTTAVLARLLTPADFGLIAMTMACTGFIGLFSDGGLTMATVQRDQITHQQISTLFWINGALGCVLAALLFAVAPLIATFYHDPRITDITRVLAACFVLSGFAVQHKALMRREFRFKTLAAIDVGALVAGALTAVVMASRGFGYWSLVGMTVVMSLVAAVSVWLIVPWRPGRPRRRAGAGSMLRFGSDVLSYNFVTYLKSQADLLLIGWQWGPMAVGFYEKAYRMLLMPLRQLNLPLGAVLIPALSRIVSDAPRLTRLYLRALELLLGVTIPLVGGIALFADEVVRLWLGPQWAESARLFRLLTAAAIVGAMINPVGWLLVALGQTRKYKWIGVATSAVHVIAFIIGLPHGPGGVALAYSISSVLLVFPTWAWALRDTPVAFRAVLRALSPSLVAAVPAALAGYGLLHAGFLPEAPVARTGLAGVAYGAIYAGVLLVWFDRWKMYAGVIQELKSARQPPGVVT